MEKSILIMLALSSIKGVGRKTLRKASDEGFRTRYTSGSTASIQEALDVSAEMAAAIKKEFSWEAAKRKYTYCEERDIHILIRKHDKYPACLSEIPDPPELVYAIGNLDLLEREKLSIVGTRTPTVYGKHVACTLAREIAARGIPVVSGLARGIDSQTHRGALEAGGPTIGVLGCAIDQIYPKENKALFAEVKKTGLLLSYIRRVRSSTKVIFRKEIGSSAGFPLERLSWRRHLEAVRSSRLIWRSNRGGMCLLCQARFILLKAQAVII
jgi:DNA processing protein